MCDECGKVCWQAPPMTEEEQDELETHIAKLIGEAEWLEKRTEDGQ